MTRIRTDGFLNREDSKQKETKIMFCLSWSLRYLLLKGLCGAVSCHALRLLLNHSLLYPRNGVVSFISVRGR